MNDKNDEKVNVGITKKAWLEPEIAPLNINFQDDGPTDGVATGSF